MLFYVFSYLPKKQSTNQPIENSKDKLGNRGDVTMHELSSKGNYDDE